MRVRAATAIAAMASCSPPHPIVAVLTTAKTGAQRGMTENGMMTGTMREQGRTNVCDECLTNEARIEINVGAFRGHPTLREYVMRNQHKVLATMMYSDVLKGENSLLYEWPEAQMMTPKVRDQDNELFDHLVHSGPNGSRLCICIGCAKQRVVAESSPMLHPILVTACTELQHEQPRPMKQDLPARRRMLAPLVENMLKSQGDVDPMRHPEIWAESLKMFKIACAVLGADEKFMTVGLDRMQETAAFISQFLRAQPDQSLEALTQEVLSCGNASAIFGSGCNKETLRMMIQRFSMRPSQCKMMCIITPDTLPTRERQVLSCEDEIPAVGAPVASAEALEGLSADFLTTVVTSVQRCAFSPLRISQLLWPMLQRLVTILSSSRGHCTEADDLAHAIEKAIANIDDTIGCAIALTEHLVDLVGFVIQVLCPLCGAPKGIQSQTKSKFMCGNERCQGNAKYPPDYRPAEVDTNFMLLISIVTSLLLQCEGANADAWSTKTVQSLQSNNTRLSTPMLHLVQRPLAHPRCFFAEEARRKVNGSAYASDVMSRVAERSNDVLDTLSKRNKLGETSAAVDGLLAVLALIKAVISGRSPKAQLKDDTHDIVATSPELTGKKRYDQLRSACTASIPCKALVPFGASFMSAICKILDAYANDDMPAMEAWKDIARNELPVAGKFCNEKRAPAIALYDQELAPCLQAALAALLRQGLEPGAIHSWTEEWRKSGMKYFYALMGLRQEALTLADKLYESAMRDSGHVPTPLVKYPSCGRTPYGTSLFDTSNKSRGRRNRNKVNTPAPRSQSRKRKNRDEVDTVRPLIGDEVDTVMPRSQSRKRKKRDEVDTVTPLIGDEVDTVTPLIGDEVDTVMPLIGDEVVDGEEMGDEATGPYMFNGNETHMSGNQQGAPDYNPDWANEDDSD